MSINTQFFNHQDDMRRIDVDLNNASTFFCSSTTLNTIPIKALSELITKTAHKFPFSVESKKIYAHFKKQENHFLLEVLFSRWPANQYFAKNARLFSFADVQAKFIGGPGTEDEFLDFLKKKPLVEEQQRKETEEETSTPLLEQVELRNMKVELSDEMLMNQQGLRGIDHQISTALLQKCLKKKEKMLSKLIESRDKFMFFFKIKQSGGQSKVLNISGIKIKEDSSPEPKVIIYTAFFVSERGLKRQFTSELACTCWVNNLSTIEFSTPTGHSQSIYTETT